MNRINVNINICQYFSLQFLLRFGDVYECGLDGLTSGGGGGDGGDGGDGGGGILC